MKLSLRGHENSCLPRVLWQQLFNHYRSEGGSLDNMDNILIDLENCKEVFRERLWEEESVSFMLSFDEFSTSWEWGWDKLPIYDKYLLVKVTWDEVEIELCRGDT